ncbi:nitrogenase reductase [Ammonifex thiophilus]|uniref:Nitrogenase reductase n=1 Tax=Ammonifex thiophilus TaxID=444093 RepID=A0A3D8P305_9THEO|nr:nitrogenase reductase [Ammonifex thiophilus]RDV80505.1 nitrogenase reductase [Ammonifex thiophilus]
MPKVIVCGRGGSGKSTLVVLLAKALAERGKVLVVDADESNLGLPQMLGQEAPAKTLMGCLGGKKAVRERLKAALRGEGGEKVAFFTESFTPDDLPDECVSGKWPVKFLRVGKIEHSMEGCACPMGALARSFLKHLQTGSEEWVLVDTEAGVEHFGRGLLEGVDLVLGVVDPSYEAVLLAERARALTAEAGKKFGVVLNKVSEETEAFLRQELSARGIEVWGVLKLDTDIMRANLKGEPVPLEGTRRQMETLVTKLIT